MNILFVVILAVFYAVGSIVRAKSNKSKQEDEGQQPAPKPRFKLAQQTAYRQPQHLVARTAQQPQIPPARRKTQSMEPQLAQATELLQEQKPPSLQFDIAPPQKSFTKPLKELEVGQVLTQPRGIQPRTIIVEEPLVNFGAPDELKKAILHYEILGKPLALRKPTVDSY